jgi:hypothetical protein
MLNVASNKDRKYRRPKILALSSKIVAGLATVVLRYLFLFCCPQQKHRKYLILKDFGHLLINTRGKAQSRGARAVPSTFGNPSRATIQKSRM